jgi:hypothetical protein
MIRIAAPSLQVWLQVQAGYLRYIEEQLQAESIVFNECKIVHQFLAVNQKAQCLHMPFMRWDDANLSYYYSPESTKYGIYYRLKISAPGFPDGFYAPERRVEVSYTRVT